MTCLEEIGHVRIGKVASISELGGENILLSATFSVKMVAKRSGVFLIVLRRLHHITYLTKACVVMLLCEKGHVSISESVVFALLHSTLCCLVDDFYTV